MALNMFAGHKTDEVLDTMQALNITSSMIPGGYTSMVQPIDISINGIFKHILKVSIRKAISENKSKKGYSSINLLTLFYI